jgi:hypothetical protein
MPYSRTKPPSWAPNAVPTARGWESPDGELLISMRNNPPISRVGVGGIAKIKFLGNKWLRNGNCGLVVKFNDYVNVTAGAHIELQGTGLSGNLVLYAATQLNTSTVLFDRKSDMQMAQVPNEAATYRVIPQSIVGTITDSDGDGATSKVVSTANAVSASIRVVA